MKSVRAGIIGIGNIGSAHASCIHSGNVEGLTLAALCDISDRVRSTVREKYPDVPIFADYNELLKQDDIDMVIVSVPHPLHTKIAEEVLKAGKHVLVEKPLDITASGARKLIEASRKSDRLFGVMLNQRTNPLFVKAREIVQSGSLGQLKRTIWIITNWYRTQHYYDSGTWRATWLGEGGGVLVNQAPHQLDLWQWICGMPESVTGFCEEGKYHNIEVEDNATILAKFPGGADGLFVTSTGEFPGTNRLEISGSKGKLVLENGKLKWWKLAEDERDFCKSHPESFGRIDYTYEEFTQEQEISGHRSILQNFTNSILHGEPLIAPGADGIQEVLIQNAAYYSAWIGNCAVPIPFDEAAYDALLKQKQHPVSAEHTAESKELNTQYKERWQVNW